MDHLKTRIRHVPDFPKTGILFYDITTLLQDAEGLHAALDALSTPFKDQKIDLVVGVESRGFIFGAAVADRIGAGFSPVRKPGKLPSKTRTASYALEYGTDSLEIHDDAVRPGQRVLIVDDLLATGGTAKATTDLVKALGGHVHALAFLIELVALNGRAKLPGEQVHAVLQVLVLTLLAALIVVGGLAWAARTVTQELREARVVRARERHLTILSLFAPGMSAAASDPRAFLTWQPLAVMARRMYPDEFAELDRARGATFPFSKEQLQTAHSRWTADWLGWEQAHSTEFKLKAASAAQEFARTGDSPAARAQCEAVEREKLERYQQHYEEYVRIAKGLQGLIQ